MGNFSPACTGIFGKLPAKGDFLRANLPEEFVAPLDAWCRACLVASRAALDDGWEEAWMSAPVWRFFLPAGACGPQAALGLWLPSVDKVGRHYPFLLCALADSAMDLEDGGAWMDMAEAAGLAAVVEDAPHEAVAAALEAPVPDDALPGLGWWTEGSPLVKPRRFDIPGLLPADYAGAMLRDSQVAEP